MGLTEVGDGFAIGMPSHRDVAGAHAMGDRARDLARRLEVGGQLAGDLVGLRAPCLLLALADAAVQARPARRREALVEHVAVQRVHEGVAPRDGAVGPLLQPDRAQEVPTPRQSLALVVDRVGIAVERRRDGRDGELRTGHRGRLERALLGDRQAFDLPLDHGAEPVGDGRRETVRRTGETDPSLLRADDRLAHGEIDQVDDEEGMALGARVDERRHAVVHDARAEALAEVGRDRGRAERLQPDLLAAPARRQLLHHGAQRMLARITSADR